jgi:hypothetical protein
MARTELKSSQIHDGSIQNIDIDTSTPGKALITKLVAGNGIVIDSTGIDSGTGIVTVSTDVANQQTQQITYIQSSPSDTWVINHNLNAYPEVVIIDDSGMKVMCDLYYDSANTVRVIVETALSGKAALTADITQVTSFIQSTASDTWDIVHNLNRYPDVIIFDTNMDNLRVYGDINYVSLNEIIVTFGYPVAGELHYI